MAASIVRNDEPWRWDPFRRPCWRWDLAGEVASGELLRSRGLDDATKAAVAFRRCHEQSDACPGRRRKGPHDAAVAGDLELHESGGPQTWELQARLLAGQTNAEIAAQCKLSEETVHMYDRLFFDVRAHRDAWAWICSQVFGGRLRRGFGGDEMGRIWQALAYSGGPIILDAVIASSKACCRPGEPPTVSACLAEGSSMSLPMQATMAVMVLPQLPLVDQAFCSMHLRLLETGMTQNPNAAQAARNDVAQQMVKLARAFLAGEPVPRPGHAQDGDQDQGQMPDRRTTRTCSTTSRRVSKWAGNDDATADCSTFAAAEA